MMILAGSSFFHNVVIPFGLPFKIGKHCDSKGVKYKSGKFGIGYPWGARIGEDGTNKDRDKDAGTKARRRGRMRSMPDERI
jgi:hypothetical protein